MDCDRAQFVMTLYLTRDPGLSPQELDDLRAHLQSCPECVQAYRDTRWVIALVKDYGSLCGVPCELLENEGCEVQPKKRPMTIDEGWEDLKRRIPELAKLDAQQKRRKMIRRIGKIAALAASIVLIFSLGWKFFNSQFSPSKVIPAVVTFNPTLELIEGNQPKPLALGQPIVTQSQKQTIQLGKIHRLMMNTGTSVTIRANQLNGKTRYNLELTQGELYVEVVPGSPFTIKTPNANLIITGTKFNVRYDQNQTGLTLVKGSIHFGNNKNQWTDVTAGHCSSVLADASPTTPQITDTSMQIAWTKETTEKNAVAKTALENSEYEIKEKPFGKPWAGLETLDYATWTAENRSWFQKEFPWIFNAEKALKDQGIETDYVTLLMVSGDIWQFRYPCSRNQPLAVINPAGLKRIANFYQIDPSVLENLVPQTTSALNQNPQSYQDALKLWQQDIKQIVSQSEMPTELGIFTLRATKYLSQTQSAVYLWIKTHPELTKYLLSNPSYMKTYITLASDQTLTLEFWLKAIQEKITALQIANITTQELLYAPNASDCSSPARQLMQQLEQEISPLMSEDSDDEATNGGNSRWR